MAGPIILRSGDAESGGYWHIANCGFSGRSSLRLCAVLGMISSLLYISASAAMLVHLKETDSYSEGVGASLNSCSIAVLVASTLQLISDFILFLLSSRPVKWKLLLTWGCCILDRILFFVAFFCSIYVVKDAVPDEGVYLLLALLFAIVCRIYIMFVFRQAVNELRQEQGELPVLYPCYPILICFPV